MRGLVETQHVTKYFPVRRGLWEVLARRPQLFVRAVAGVSIRINEGEVMALAGESGSGKTTLGRLLIGLVPASEGRVLFEGRDLRQLEGVEAKAFRRQAQMIFQDPNSSLNPRMKAGRAVKHALDIHTRDNESTKVRRVHQIFERVGLVPAEKFYDRYPHELSGGQRQRVALARALVLEPRFIVADEPVAMVDVSVRAQILDLMMDLKRDFNLTYMIITHDLALAHYMADRVAVMYLGKIVESGTRQQIFEEPLHPYTQALIQAIPIPRPGLGRERRVVGGEVPSAITPPPGCAFHPRCPYAMQTCLSVEPRLVDVGHGHLVSCHLYPQAG
jgi:peptide/nickel transport system ATP-binding protein